LQPGEIRTAEQVDEHEDEGDRVQEDRQEDLDQELHPVPDDAMRRR
jgi:hypothetical protein